MTLPHASIDQELIRASNGRRAGLAAEREIVEEKIGDWKEDLDSLEKDEDGYEEERAEYELDIAGALSRLEEVRLAELVRAST